MDIKPFSIIVACTEEGGIGFSNKIPWYIPDDLKNFKRITTYNNSISKINAVIMGRRTWESLSVKPLPNRINIIISSSNTMVGSNQMGVIIARNLVEALEIVTIKKNIDKVFVIGGEQLYNEAIRSEYCEKIYMTVLYKRKTNENKNEREMIKCDKFFPIDYTLSNYSITDLSDTIIYNEFVYINYVLVK